jgi:hypothetical protein
MLKIIELRASLNPQSEYIVLENQGLNSVSLRGYALCTDAFLCAESSRLAEEMFIFQEDICLKPFMRVVLLTGEGESGWMPTVDGKQAYCIYWNRGSSVWTKARDVHVLHIAASRRVVAELIPLSA